MKKTSRKKITKLHQYQDSLILFIQYLIMTRYQREVDFQQICTKGHQITDCRISNPSAQRNYCSQCGAPTIISCPNCDVPIPGRITIIDTGYDTTDHIVLGKVPEYCENCGKPFPWVTDRKISDKQIGNSPRKSSARKSCPKPVKETLWRNHFGDSLSGKCYVCQKSIDFTTFEVGHNTPYVNGGEWNISNLKPLCRSCNRSMSTMTIEEFKKKHFR